MSKRCRICGTMNSDQANVCKNCGSSEISVIENKVIYHKENVVVPSKTENALSNKPTSKIMKLTIIEQLEILTKVMFGILIIATIVTFIKFLIDKSFLLAATTLLILPIIIYIYYVIMMSYVSHLKNGERSKNELIKIREVLEEKQKSVD